MLATFVICLGYVPSTEKLFSDVEIVLMTPTAQPHIQVLYNVTQSVAGVTVLSTVIVIMAIFGCVNMVAICSRQLYAFARDDSLPFSAFLALVRPGWDLPLNSTFVSFGITVALSLINIGCKSPTIPMWRRINLTEAQQPSHSIRSLPWEPPPSCHHMLSASRVCLRSDGVKRNFSPQTFRSANPVYGSMSWRWCGY